MDALPSLPGPSPARAFATRRPAPVAVLAVLALHLAAWWCWQASLRSTPRPTRDAPHGWIELRLIEAVPHAPPTASPTVAPLAQPPQPTTVAVPRAGPAPRRAAPFQAITAAPSAQDDRPPAPPAPSTGSAASTSMDAPLPEATAAAPPDAVTPAAASAPVPAHTPLRLDLPRGALAGPGTTRSPALDDPRIQAPRPSLEARFGNAIAGTPGLVEEFRGEGRRRFRSGTACVDVRDGRGAGLDPFGAATRPNPKLAEDCAPR